MRKRELNEIARRVLESAAELESESIERSPVANPSPSPWHGPRVMLRMFPGINRFATKELGVSSAIQTLIRRGLVRRIKHGHISAGYLLTETGRLAAMDSAAQREGE